MPKKTKKSKTAKRSVTKAKPAARLRFRKPAPGAMWKWECTECRKEAPAEMALLVDPKSDCDAAAAELCDHIPSFPPKGWVFFRVYGQMLDFCSVACVKKHASKCLPN